MSEPGSALPDRAAIEERAVTFLERRRFWDWRAEDQAELEAWLEKSVAHRVTYLRLEAGASRLERLAALRPPKPDNGESGAAGAVTKRRVALPLLIAASTVLVAALSFPVIKYLLAPADRAFGTDVGERASIKFGDGTEIELNTDSAVRYRMTTADRMVWLEKGEAYFRVAHDRKHPFVVFSGNQRITDLGTEFLVRRDEDRLEVALIKGRASITAMQPGADAAILTPGDEAVASQKSMVVARKTVQELTDELAWQRGVIVFRNTVLAEAVREFNRYNRTKLVITDGSLARLKIGGKFKTQDVEGFVGLAQTVLKLTVVRRQNEILLSRGA